MNAMRRRPDVTIALGGMAILVAIGLISYALRSGSSTPYASDSAAGDGTLALYRWIATLGYRPARLTGTPLRLSGARALFVFEPQAAFTGPEADSVVAWVRDGGTLVLLEDSGDPTLPNRLGLSFQGIFGSSLSGLSKNAPVNYGAAPVQPLLAHPPMRGLSVAVGARVVGTSRAVLPVLGNGGVRPPNAGAKTRLAGPDASDPVLVYERLGRGHVFAGTTPDALTNGQIRTGDNRLLVPNVLAGLPAGAGVAFDDYHLTVRTAQPLTLQGVLYATAWGRALLYAFVLVAAYVVLTGRRLGRPLRAIPERGRSLSEYVISMAAIFQRAGLRGRVLGLWQEQLRHDLAGAGRGSGAMARKRAGRSDDELVAEAARRAGLTPQEQNEALALLRPRDKLGESALVDLCRRIAALQQRLNARI